MSDQRQRELFDQIRAKLCQEGCSTSYASNVKVVLENALQSYVRQIPTRATKKEALTPEQTLQKLRKIRKKALLISIVILCVIIPFCLALWSVYQSFDSCNGLFGDSVKGHMEWHQYYEKFSFTYEKFYNPKNETNLNKYPWMVRFTVFENNCTKFRCSGFLINDRDVLTAGHCFFLEEKYELHLGGTPINNYKDTIRIKKNQYKKLVHPNFNKTLARDDIALIKLNKPINFSETIYPIKLSFHNPFIPESLTLTGWNNSDPHLNPILKEALVPTIPVHYCESKTKKTIVNKVVYGAFTSEQTPVKFCAGHNDTKITRGDSGMPIQTMDENGPIAYGIISLGTKSDKTGSPQIFTNIYPYLHWILCNAGDDFCKNPK